ncbi:MAG: hypothetical protein LLG09_07515 [Negativicutes bacterium]|nr:hypothetical protein [Negativicutes bacterium]
MSRKRWPSLIILFCGLLLCLQPLRTSQASVGEAGSDSDPLITLSYLQSRLVTFKEEIQVMVGEQIQTALAALPADSDDPLAAAKWEILELSPGARLIGSEGTEMILRAGEALAIGNAENAGVADLTAGSDLKTGDAVLCNHHLLIPRTDGRGLNIRFFSYVMVKGAYTITTN